MAIANRTTKVDQPSPPALGVPMTFPQGREHEITIILRVILAISDIDDSIELVEERRDYEALASRLASYSRNLKDVAMRIREVTGYAER